MAEGQDASNQMPGDADAALRDDAAAFLESLNSEDSGGEDAPADTPEAPAEESEDAETAPAEDAQDPEEAGEEAGTEDEPEDEEESEDDESDDDADKKPAKKPSTYQRMKTKVERMRKEVTELSQERDTVKAQFDDLVEEVQHWPTLLEETQAENAKLRELLKDAGYDTDPRDSQIAQLKAEIDALKEQPQKQAERQKRQAELQRKQQVSSLARQMRDEAEDLGDSTGIEPAKILKAHWVEHEEAKARGQEPRTMAEIAEELAEVERFRASRRTAGRLEKKVSPPPRTISKKPAAARGDFPATAEGAEAYLKSKGLI